ncbi:hypothetical protein VQ056_31225 [Paenibacillus sp. JTLBN-2024]
MRHQLIQPDPLRQLLDFPDVPGRIPGLDALDLLAKLDRQPARRRSSAAASFFCSSPLLRQRSTEIQAAV